MNVYDFDNTIYRGDSTAEFVTWLWLHYPKTLLNLPRTAVLGLLYVLHVVPKMKFKQGLYRMFAFVTDMDRAADEFVESHMDHIKSWYLSQQKPDDMVISASPLFLISRFCERLNIKDVMASPVEISTGTCQGDNCHGKEKVRLFYEVHPEGVIDEFYSDSYTDSPLAEIAKKAYLVKGDERLDWGMRR